MTDVDEIVASLQQLETAVRSAIGAVERAGRFAERLEQDLGRTGLRRMALRMREVSTSVRQAHKRLGVQAQTVASVSSTVSMAPVATDPTAATLETIDLEHPRSQHAQKTLSGKLPGDDAGHLFARIFKGPGQKINLAPMESLGVNRGEYGRLERLWRAKIEAGEQVEVEVRLVYSDANDRRPTNFRVRHRHTVGGELGQIWKRVNIDNTPAER